MNDQKIIAAIKAGESAAIQAVIEKYSRLLWSVAGPILYQASGIQDIEECVADVFIELWQHPEKFEPERGSLKTWLSIRARTMAIDRFRALSRNSALALEETCLPDELDVAELVQAEEDKTVLTAAVNALEEPDREILVRRYYYGQKPRQIAQALDLPVKTVENKLYRTKQKLRCRLAR